MTKIKKRAVEMLEELPDDKVVYVIEILKGLKGLYGDTVTKTDEPTESQMAFEGLKKYKGRVPVDIDEKDEC